MSASHPVSTSRCCMLLLTRVGKGNTPSSANKTAAMTTPTMPPVLRPPTPLGLSL